MDDIDYAKAFDTVNYGMLWSALTDHIVPVHLVWLVSQLYITATGTVRVDQRQTNSDSSRVCQQGCLISPLLFNKVEEAMHFSLIFF